MDMAAVSGLGLATCLLALPFVRSMGNIFLFILNTFSFVAFLGPPGASFPGEFTIEDVLW